jgi:FMN phosphatase YigB (HAD superfamily)
MPIRIITIDLWNTLMDSSNGDARREARRQAVRSHVERMGHTIDDEKLLTYYQNAWEYFNTTWRTEHKTPPTRSVVEHLWKQANIVPDDMAVEALTKDFCEGVLVHPPALLPGVKDALEELSQDYYLALISDTAFSPGPILRQLMEQYEIAQFFSAFSFSDETGVSKPHPLAFETAIRNSGAKPEEGVHVGDIERTDVVGAKNFGMKAIRFLGDNDPNVGNDHDQPTIADAEAASWPEVVRLVRAMDNRQPL